MLVDHRFRIVPIGRARHKEPDGTSSCPLGAQGGGIRSAAPPSCRLNSQFRSSGAEAFLMPKNGTGAAAVLFAGQRPLII
jgi:hypothetical protein